MMNLTRRALLTASLGALVMTAAPQVEAAPNPFRVATTNIGASNSAVDGLPPWRERLARTIGVIHDEALTIAALQEVMADQWLALHAALGGYDWWPTVWGSSNKYAGINPVLFRRDRARFLKGDILYPPALQTISHRSKGLAVVHLDVNGRRVIVASVHDPAQNSQAAIRLANERWYRAQAARYHADYPDAVIVWAGDYNSPYVINRRQFTTVDNDPTKLVTPVMERGGLLRDPFKGSPLVTSRTVDRIFLSVPATRLTARPAGSDIPLHEMLIADVAP